MPEDPPITPSQIRAGRALVDWSQERLAAQANVSLSTVRDYEKERRGDILVVEGLRAIRKALERKNVHFLRSEGDFGPGVRLRAVMPNVLRWPIKLGRFESLLIPIEWRGQEVEVYLPQALLDDLGRFPKTQPEGEYLRLFEQYREEILKAAAMAIDAGRVGMDKRVHLTHDDLPPVASAPAFKSSRRTERRAGIKKGERPS
jgi:transcriptional regulator with XRE-family HTH domain